MTKPREYWVLTTDDQARPIIRDMDRLCLDYEPEAEEEEVFTHVIEYSAIKEIMKKLVITVTKYHEYFGAIEVGEYEKNGRPSPLRDYENMMQDKAESLLNECKELLK